VTEASAKLGALEASREAASLDDYLSDETVVLPPFLGIEDAARQIEELFQSSGGATFSLYFGNMISKPFIAVSLYQDPAARHSKWWNGKSLSQFKLRAFISGSRELLEEPRNSIGVWYDAENDRTYLEVTATLLFLDKPDYTGAIHHGRRYNQIGIYDLEERAYIALGGTGELSENIPPIPERLPVLQRGRDL
jgi:hypothetical protein